MPNFELSEEEKQLSETARDFARKEIVPVAGELDEHGTFPEAICKKGWETGLMNCEIPEAYGGLGLSCLAHCLVLEEISYGCTGVNTTMAANMLGSMPTPRCRRRSTWGAFWPSRSSPPTAAPSLTPARTWQA